jgi:hypothetical protein
VVKEELTLGEFFAEMDMQAPMREGPARVRVIRYYCASCASCLATDVATDRAEPVSPVLAGAVESARR